MAGPVDAVGAKKSVKIPVDTQEGDVPIPKGAKLACQCYQVETDKRQDVEKLMSERGKEFLKKMSVDKADAGTCICGIFKEPPAKVGALKKLNDKQIEGIKKAVEAGLKKTYNIVMDGKDEPTRVFWVFSFSPIRISQDDGVVQASIKLYPREDWTPTSDLVAGKNIFREKFQDFMEPEVRRYLRKIGIKNPKIEVDVLSGVGDIRIKIGG